MGDEGFGLIQIFQHILGMMCMDCWRPSERQWCLMSCSFISGDTRSFGLAVLCFVISCRMVL